MNATRRPGDRALARAGRLTALQRELLTVIYDFQRQFLSGRWSFDGTVYSRTMFALAGRHKKLKPSPVRGKKNVDRAFESKVAKAFKALVAKRLASWRKTSGPDGPAQFALGYKRHRSRDRDIQLTANGLAQAEEALRAAGLMAVGIDVGCVDTTDPAGPSASGQSGCED
jgi:hypothetical protein